MIRFLIQNVPLQGGPTSRATGICRAKLSRRAAAVSRGGNQIARARRHGPALHVGSELRSREATKRRRAMAFRGFFATSLLRVTDF